MLGRPICTWRSRFVGDNQPAPRLGACGYGGREEGGRREGGGREEGGRREGGGREEGRSGGGKGRGGGRGRGEGGRDKALSNGDLGEGETEHDVQADDQPEESTDFNEQVNRQ